MISLTTAAETRDRGRRDLFDQFDWECALPARLCAGILAPLLASLQAPGSGLTTLRHGHCLSYTATFLYGLPSRSVPLTVTVRLLPSAETTIRPLPISLPWFIVLNSAVRSSRFLYERASEVESPMTG